MTSTRAWSAPGRSTITRATSARASTAACSAGSSCSPTTARAAPLRVAPARRYVSQAAQACPSRRRSPARWRTSRRTSRTPRADAGHGHGVLAEIVAAARSATAARAMAAGTAGTAGMAAAGTAARSGGASSISEHKGVLAFLEEYTQLALRASQGRQDAARADLLSPHEPRPWDAGLQQRTDLAGGPAVRGDVRRRGDVLATTARSTSRCRARSSSRPARRSRSTVAIHDTDAMNMRFDPVVARVRPGGTVRWTRGNDRPHRDRGRRRASRAPCFNGRTFIGNCPTIVAQAGQRIRWYVFNLDLGMNWHNFHPHAQRWTFANEPIDVAQHRPRRVLRRRHRRPAGPAAAARHRRARRIRAIVPRRPSAYDLRGDFLFHCHVEMHMMQGLAGLGALARRRCGSRRIRLEYSARERAPVGTLPERLPDVLPRALQELFCGECTLSRLPEVCMMHATLVPRSQGDVLRLRRHPRRIRRVWDIALPKLVPTTNQPYDVTQPPHNRALANIWSAEHAYLADPSAASSCTAASLRSRPSYSTRHCSARASATAQDRFYSTTLTLATAGC